MIKIILIKMFQHKKEHKNAWKPNKYHNKKRKETENDTKRRIIQWLT